MYSTCLHCTRPLGTNDVIEALPIGRRVAFDAAQGRLWVVCRHCAKWNLVPFDTRLESIDACERLYRDTAKRYSTGTIGLARTREGLDLVRIGAALRPEFAAWRYGRGFFRRRVRAVALTGAAGFALAGTMLTINLIGQAGWRVGMGLFQGVALTGAYWGWARSRSWTRLRALDPSGEAVVDWKERHVAAFIVIGDAGSGLHVVSGAGGEGPEHYYQGAAAERILRQALPRVNRFDGSKSDVAEAIGALERHPTMHSLLTDFEGEQPFAEVGPGEMMGWTLAGMPKRFRLALEMSMNEESERVWLSGELRLLELEWREAEKLAEISDELGLPDQA
jgi:hypothetical protein